MDRREEYRAAIAASSCGRRRSIDVVEGFWPGVVRIVRPASRRDGDENEGEGEGGDLDGHGRLFGLKLENG